MQDIWIIVIANASLFLGHYLIKIGGILIDFGKKLKDPEYKQKKAEAKLLKAQQKINKQHEALLLCQSKLQNNEVNTNINKEVLNQSINTIQ